MDAAHVPQCLSRESEAALAKATAGATSSEVILAASIQEPRACHASAACLASPISSGDCLHNVQCSRMAAKSPEQPIHLQRQCSLHLSVQLSVAFGTSCELPAFAGCNRCNLHKHHPKTMRFAATYCVLLRQNKNPFSKVTFTVGKPLVQIHMLCMQASCQSAT